MSHPEQQAFFSLVVERNAAVIRGGRILEIGSYDVNGSVRSLFESAGQYIGVDLVEGPGVDLVAFGHEVAEETGAFDVTLAGECFEHDPYWVETLTNMVRMTRSGGLVAFTCASRGRPEHGTQRTTLNHSPGTQNVGLDHYRNVLPEDLRQLPLENWFDAWDAWYIPTSFDLYFAGVRRGTSDAPMARLPDATAVERIRRLMPLSHRLVRMPLRLATRFAGENQERYQRVILPYWLGMRSVFGDRSESR